jgi:hypothetical protein
MARLSRRAPERRLLQAAVAAAALVPVLAGLSGVNGGLAAFDPHALTSLTGDSHVRYLSGLLLAVGLAFWSTLPAIEARGASFRLLTALVLVGGLARLYAAERQGWPGAVMTGGLMMELAVAPGLALWRESFERRQSNNQGRSA